MLSRITSRLAARQGVRQVEAVVKADAAALAADAAVHRTWQSVLALLRHPHGMHAMHAAALTAFRGLTTAVAHQTATALRGIAAWGHRSAASVLRRELPAKYVRATVQLRGRRLHESRDSGAPLLRARLLLEDEGSAESGFDWLDLVRQWHAPHDASTSMPDLFALLFPPPSEQDVHGVVFGGNWMTRLAASTRLASPERLAGVLVSGMSRGLDQRQIAKELLPIVDGVRSSAKRIARTEGLRVAGAMQMQCYRSLGSIVAGYQIHATIDQHTRPWHAHRSGTIYWLKPRPGQKGMEQCPHPPEEAADPGERPAGTPQIAHNCRCYLTPVLSALEGDDAPAETHGPDHTIYSDWFAGADEKRRMVAVGVKRYRAVHAATRGKPRWEHFIDEKGSLLHHDHLRAESAVQRNERAAKVRAGLLARGHDVREVARQGYVSA